MQYWFQGIYNEEGFDPGEVPPIKVKKKQINTHAILSIVNLEEMREIFSEGGVIMFFLHV